MQSHSEKAKGNNMAAEHEERNTTTRPTSGTGNAEPAVEVYDTTSPGTTKGVRTEDRTRGTTYATSTTSDAGTTKPGTNWTAIIIAILVVLALILLVVWLF